MIRDISQPGLMLSIGRCCFVAASAIVNLKVLPSPVPAKSVALLSD